jgi:hypothetical protein
MEVPSGALGTFGEVSAVDKPFSIFSHSIINDYGEKRKLSIKKIN